ncbi:type II restriction enzyme [Robertmurraya siralis]|uniref:type II restriction enzyme n=1 Tax=Robertmurraya siralis TaxID=77777 RepID=UPI0010F47486|nr:translation elongation factor [Robertmurraya siralis]
MKQIRIDKAWKILFERHKIIQNVHKKGIFVIQAKEIESVKPARLMVNFEHSSHLPKVFKENNLSILPISRTSYAIGVFNVYNQLNYNSRLKPIPVDFPSEIITTIQPTNLYSKSAALHCAYLTGMMERVLGEEVYPTISGRMVTEEFEFGIRTKKGFTILQNKNSLINIDGYESQNQFMIIDAKNETVDDFLIKRLYYSYRFWQRKTPKSVIPVFFTYSNDIFSFFIYEFEDSNYYNSLRLIEQKDFVIAQEGIELDDIIEIFNTSHIVREPEIPFPQADSFTRIVDLLGQLVENNLSRDQITLNYDFSQRQTGYYTSAGMYLGLIEKYKGENKRVMFRLTKAGREIMGLKTREKFLELSKCILAHEPFKLVLAEYFDKGAPPAKSCVVELMKNYPLYNVHKESTYFRRASTVMGWVNWILQLPETY